MLLHCGRVNSLFKLLKWSQPYRVRYVEYILYNKFAVIIFYVHSNVCCTAKAFVQLLKICVSIDLLCIIESNVLVK